MEDNEIKEPEVKESENVEEKKEEVKQTVVTEAFLAEIKKEIAESIRKEEKDKLYPQIEKLKQEAKAKEEALVEAQKQVEEFKSKNMTDDEKLQLKLRELEDAKASLETKMEEFASRTATEIYKVKLEAELEKQLLKYKDEVIPELVTGGTIEEIQQSAENAHRRFLELKAGIEEEVKSKIKAEPKEPKSIGTGIEPVKRGTKMIGEIDIDKITDEKEWKAARQRLLDEAFKHSS